MNNLFDNIQEATYDVVTATMGYDASWTPAAGGSAMTAKVLLNKPTQKDRISDEIYDAISPKCEYKEGDFPGLYESVRSNVNEVVIINSISYNAYRAEKKFDGKTIVLSLQQD